MYNTRLSSIRSIIKRAFALLKGKWRRLKYLDVKSVKIANCITAAACTLHNFLLLHNQADIRENHHFNHDYEYGDDDENSDSESDPELEGDNANARNKRIQIMNRL